MPSTVSQLLGYNFGSIPLGSPVQALPAPDYSRVMQYQMKGAELQAQSEAERQQAKAAINSSLQAPVLAEDTHKMAVPIYEFGVASFSKDTKDFIDKWAGVDDIERYRDPEYTKDFNALMQKKEYIKSNIRSKSKAFENATKEFGTKATWTQQGTPLSSAAIEWEDILTAFDDYQKERDPEAKIQKWINYEKVSNSMGSLDFMDESKIEDIETIAGKETNLGEIVSSMLDDTQQGQPIGMIGNNYLVRMKSGKTTITRNDEQIRAAADSVGNAVFNGSSAPLAMAQYLMDATGMQPRDFVAFFEYFAKDPKKSVVAGDNPNEKYDNLINAHGRMGSVINSSNIDKDKVDKYLATYAPNSIQRKLNLYGVLNIPTGLYEKKVNKKGELVDADGNVVDDLGKAADDTSRPLFMSPQKYAASRAFGKLLPRTVQKMDYDQQSISTVKAVDETASAINALASALSTPSVNEFVTKSLYGEGASIIKDEMDVNGNKVPVDAGIVPLAKNEQESLLKYVYDTRSAKLGGKEINLENKDYQSVTIKHLPEVTNDGSFVLYDKESPSEKRYVVDQKGNVGIQKPVADQNGNVSWKTVDSDFVALDVLGGNSVGQLASTRDQNGSKFRLIKKGDQEKQGLIRNYQNTLARVKNLENKILNEKSSQAKYSMRQLLAAETFNLSQLKEKLSGLSVPDYEPIVIPSTSAYINIQFQSDESEINGVEGRKIEDGVYRYDATSYVPKEKIPEISQYHYRYNQSMKTDKNAISGAPKLNILPTEGGFVSSVSSKKNN